MIFRIQVRKRQTGSGGACHYPEPAEKKGGAGGVGSEWRRWIKTNASIFPGSPAMENASRKKGFAVPVSQGPTIGK
jgi:hypothetical protein